MKFKGHGISHLCEDWLTLRPMKSTKSTLWFLMSWIQTNRWSCQRSASLALRAMSLCSVALVEFRWFLKTEMTREISFPRPITTECQNNLKKVHSPRHQRTRNKTLRRQNTTRTHWADRALAKTQPDQNKETNYTPRLKKKFEVLSHGTSWTQSSRTQWLAIFNRVLKECTFSKNQQVPPRNGTGKACKLYS